MTQENNLTTNPADSRLLAKRMLIGAGIALVPISLLLLSVGEPNPEWPKFWMIRPLVVVPFAGACGGVFYHLMDFLRHRGGWRKVVANVLSVIVFIFGLWMGTVLGLVGTLWH